jgi:hypothetical protein
MIIRSVSFLKYPSNSRLFTTTCPFPGRKRLEPLKTFFDRFHGELELPRIILKQKSANFGFRLLGGVGCVRRKTFLRSHVQHSWAASLDGDLNHPVGPFAWVMLKRISCRPET